MWMLSVVASLFVGLAAPEGDEFLEAPLSTEPDDAAPRRLDCAYGADREDYNLCLARCDDDEGYYDVVGYAVRDTRKNREKCNKEARRFCKNYGMTLDHWCWGQDFDDWEN